MFYSDLVKFFRSLHTQCKEKKIQFHFTSLVMCENSGILLLTVGGDTTYTLELSADPLVNFSMMEQPEKLAEYLVQNIAHKERYNA